jgi:hypothetical protein
MCFWGWVGDALDWRWSMMIPAFIGIFITPSYLLTADPTWIIAGFLLQSPFAGSLAARWLASIEAVAIRPLTSSSS